MSSFYLVNLSNTYGFNTCPVKFQKSIAKFRRSSNTYLPKLWGLTTTYFHPATKIQQLKSNHQPRPLIAKPRD